jgi:serine/threonine-protein kinase
LARSTDTEWWREHEYTLTSHGPLDEDVDPLFEEPPQVARYENLRRLGGGAAGEVWLVRDRELQREVALKLSRGNDARTAGQFALEAQITSQLDHPSIPPVYDAGVDDLARPFITSKLIRGHQPLNALIEHMLEHDGQASHDFGYAHRVQVVLQVAYALDYAHRRAVVHQDVKPENIVLGSFGEVYLLDWGVATVAPHEQADDEHEPPIRVAGHGEAEFRARDDWVVGTPLYMSPEQYAGDDPPHPRNDLYSLCAVLYELLALRHYLTEADDLSDVEAFGEAIRTHVPPSPYELFEGSERPPRELADLCLRGLRKRPEERFESAWQLREALQEWLDSVH